MNKFTLLPVLLLLFLNARAQDKIISTNNDTIHCKIVSISNDRILYELKNTDGTTTGKFMSLSQVAEYSKSSQAEKKSKTEKTDTPLTPSYDGARLYLGLNLGYSSMPWYLDNLQLSSIMPDYYNNLKTGFHINASLHYMVNSLCGLGAEYSFFNTSVNGSTPIEYSSSVYLLGYEKCREYINYIGASVLFQQHLDAQQKFLVSESVSAGVLFLRLEDQGTYPNVSQLGYNDISENLLLTGNSPFGKLGLTAEYKFFESVSVGFGGDLIWCSLKKVSYESNGSDYYSQSSGKEKLSDPLKLSRIDFSFIVRYRF